jgi:hypothetical protein
MGLAMLGGALQGLGNGLYETGKLNALQRYEAMKEERTQKRDLEKLRVAGEINDKNKANEQFRSAVYDEKNDARAAEAQTTIQKLRNQGQVDLKNLEAANAEKLAGLQHQYKMDETQSEIAQRTLADINKMKIEVGDVRVSDSGRLVFYSKTGDLISQTEPHQFPISESSVSSTPDATRQKLPPADSPSGDGAATPAAAKTNNVELTADLNRLGREYDSATPETHPGLFRNGHKISLEEARDMIRRAYGGE